jgi:hypothetical protein
MVHRCRLRGRACAGEREGLRLGFADSGSHRGSVGRAQHVAGVAIGGRGDGEVAGARMREGGRRAGGLGRGGLRLAPGITGDGDGQCFLQETEGQVS